MKSFLTATLLAASALSTLAADVSNSVIRISSTLQNYNPSQPWEKATPKHRQAIGAIIANEQVLTTAEMVANANFIELTSIDGANKLPAKVVAVDYEANLALLEATTEEDQAFLASYKALDTTPKAHPGDTVEIVQVESNGMPLVTDGKVLSADVSSSLVPGHYFLTYEVKASMQSAAGSFTLPVLHDDKLLGLLSNYSSKHQLVDVIAPEIVTAFLKDAKDGDYQGFPSLGVATTETTDKHFRNWLKLPKEAGGLYVTRVKPNSSAAKAGLQKGDVILAVAGKEIDRMGYYKANGFGQIHWSHLIRGAQIAGNTVKLRILRDGETVELPTKLERSAEGIIPSHNYGKAPRFLVKGGFIFQELTQSYLRAYGEDWSSRAPLKLLDALNHPEDYEQNRKRLVFLSAVIPTPATLGYESLHSVIIEEVNGQPIEDIPSLIAAFEKTPANGIHALKVDNKPSMIYLDAKASDAVDSSLKQRGLPALSRSAE